MEPLAALGIAGNVIQFVQFATSLISCALVVHASASGQTGNSRRLEDIYTTLSNLSLNLQTAGTNTTDSGPGHIAAPSANAEAVGRLAAACQDDCNKLLVVLKRLKPKPGNEGRLWSSFQTALLEVWTSKEVDRFKKQVSETQNAVTLLLCKISVENTVDLNRSLQQLRIESDSLHSARAEEYNKLSGMLGNIESVAKKVMLDNVATDLPSLTPDEIDLLTTGISNLSIKCKAFGRQQRVLASLSYDQRPARLEAIPEAHRRTFSWVFSGPSRDGNGSNEFVKWLRSGSGVFWVSGKPGSGKSTLMKYVTEHAQTRETLREWAAPQRVVTGRHFFWNPGSTVQKSLIGLLRSLLYDILAQQPQLIPIVCPDRWSSTDAKRRSEESTVWTQKELVGYLRSLASLRDLSVKFCLFVDGLDEYDGDHSDVCDFLSSLVACSHIKLCVSSRPWNVFQNSFDSSDVPKLHLHDVTRNDIQAYSESRLREHRRWPVVLCNGGDASKIIEEITARSSGVFLWVYLATKVLREGLDNDDSLSDLWRRLDSIPPDLEDFFKKILEGVDSFYHDKTARTLLVALAARKPLNVAIYGFMELEYENEDYALAEAVGESDGENYRRLISIRGPVPRRLNGRCKGLLEISSYETVEFLHRTLRDYLLGAEMKQLLLQKLKRPFNVNLSITRAYVAYFKRSSSLSSSAAIAPEGGTTISELICEILLYARSAEETGNASTGLVSSLLEELELATENTSMYELLSSSLQPQSRVVRSGQHQHNTQLARTTFRLSLLSCNMFRYIEHKLRVSEDYFSAVGQTTVLQIVLNDGLDAQISSNIDEYHAQLLSVILRHGPSPNELVISGCPETSVSIWSEYASTSTEWMQGKNETAFTGSRLKFDDLLVLLDYGADPDATAYFTKAFITAFQNDSSPGDGYSLPVWVGYILGAVNSFRSKGPWVGDDFIAVLKQMFTKGSDIAIMLLPISSGKSMTRWSCLIGNLREQVMINGDYKVMKFLAKVMVVLREFDKDSVLPWDEVEEFLQETFRPVLSQKIQWVTERDRRLAEVATLEPHVSGSSGSKDRRPVASPPSSKRLRMT